MADPVPMVAIRSIRTYSSPIFKIFKMYNPNLIIESVCIPVSLIHRSGASMQNQFQDHFMLRPQYVS